MRASDHEYFDRGFIPLAHRGGALPGDEGRENTLHAFSRAVEMGFTHLETDVHATSDGELVAFHDATLDRVTDRSGRIAELSLAEVRRARIGGTDQVPTLDEVLESFPGIFINIDIKAPSAVEPLLRTLRAHRAESRVCVGSFHQSSITRFRRLAGPRVPTSVGVPGVVLHAFVPQLTRVLNSPGVVLQIPASHLVSGRTVRVLTPRLLEAAHRSGKLVHVWTINDAEQMHELIELGVDGLVSDRIDVLAQVCAEHGIWRNS